MKIVFSIDTIHRGGKERQLFVLTRSLLDKGVRVSIITKDFSKGNYLAEYGLNVDIINIFQGKSWLNKFCCFKKIVFSEKPDILISWDLQTSLFALLLYRKYSFIFINASIQHGIRLLRVSHILRSIICFLSPYVIANSFAGLKSNNLKPGKRRFVLYNGIETKFINDLSKTDTEILRKKLIPGYIENPGVVYVSVANLVPYKDYSTVLKALAQLKSDFVFYYLILGDGPMRDEIENKIIDYGLKKNVLLIGKTENVNEYLFASDLMIHSSRGEGVSNAILEGMYAGLPIITTKVGGTPEIVFPKSSVFFKYKDETGLANILLTIDEYFQEFNPKSEEYQNHLKKYSVTTMLTNFEKIIESVINEA